MESDDERFARALRAVAAEAGPLRVRFDDLHRLRHRRARQRFAAGAGAVTVLVTGAVLGSSVAAGLDRERPAKPAPAMASAGSARPSALGLSDRRAALPSVPASSTLAGASVVDGPIRITCGEPLPVTPTGSRFGGTELTIDAVAYPTAGGPPEVTYRLRFADRTARRAGHVEPQVLILRDGVVVGGPRPTEPTLERWRAQGPEQGTLWLPLATLTRSERASEWMCGIVDWAAIRSDPARYRIAVVLSVPGGAAQSPPTGPLLMAQTGVEPT